jgi:hypothetical protein
MFADVAATHLRFGAQSHHCATEVRVMLGVRNRLPKMQRTTAARERLNAIKGLRELSLRGTAPATKAACGWEGAWRR